VVQPQETKQDAPHQMIVLDEGAERINDIPLRRQFTLIGHRKRMTRALVAVLLY